MKRGQNGAPREVCEGSGAEVSEVPVPEVVAVVAPSNFAGGLRVRGMVCQRTRREMTLARGEVLESVTYSVTSENGMNTVEDFAPPAGEYFRIGQLIDVLVQIRAFRDKSGTIQTRLRYDRVNGAF